MGETATTSTETDYSDVKFTAAGVKDIWVDFLQRFRKHRQDEVLKKMGKSNDFHGFYFNLINDMMASGLKTLVVDYFDILEILDSGRDDTDKFIVIRNEVDRYPDVAAEHAKDAVLDMMEGGINRSWGNEIRNELRIVFKNNGQAIEIPDLSVDLVGRLIMIEGIVSEMDYRRTARVVKAGYICSDGQHHHVTSGKPPRECKTNDCGSNQFTFSPEDSTMQNIIEFGIQQRPDRAIPGKNDDPLNILVVGEEMSGYVIHSVMPGDFVSITGIVRLTERTKSEEGVGQRAGFFIEAQAITVKKDEYMLVEDDEITAEEVKHFVKADTEEEDFEKLVHSIAPSVRGHELPKTAALLLAAGSEPSKAPDGTRHRGALNMLWVGAKDTGKTTVAWYLQQIIERTFYNSGIGSSRAGLTASIDVSKRDSPSRLKPGAFMMAANKGCVIIDEGQDLSNDDQSALLEITDDKQTMTIRKAGVHLNPFSLDSACLLICNPVTKDQRIDPTKTIAENTGLRISLVSRMDAVFPFIDRADPIEDRKNAEHYLRTYDMMIAEKDYEKAKLEFRQNRVMSLMDAAALAAAMDIYSPNQMAHYVRYVRRERRPKLKNGSLASKRLVNWYLSMRQAHRLDYLVSDENEDMENKSQEERDALVGMRILGASTRWAEASARVCNRDEVLDIDAKRAIMLMEPGIAWAENANKAFMVMQQQRSGYRTGYSIDVDKIAAKEHQEWRKKIAEVKKRFDIGLRILCWVQHKPCGGTGFIRVPSETEDATEDDVPEDLMCQECNGRGGWNRPEGFSKDELQRNMLERWNTPYKVSQAIFDEYVKKGYLVQVSASNWRVVGNTPGVLAKPSARSTSGSINYSRRSDMDELQVQDQERPVDKLDKLDQDFQEIDQEFQNRGRQPEQSLEDVFEE